MKAGEEDAVFRFSSPGLSVDFEGPEEFVEAQLARVRDKIRQEMGLAAAAGPADAGDAAGTEPGNGATPAPALTEFYERARSREGRGALQEMILIFAFFLRTHRAQLEVSIDSLTACFDDVGAAPPRNLANTLGIMKRKQGVFAAGSARGHYALTDDGIAYVQRLIGAH